MAGLVVKNNMSAIHTLNTLNSNQNNLAKVLRKVSTGLRVNGAGDDASAYAISERMRARIRGLDQCSRNVRTGYNMLKVAAQAVGQQVDILGKMREIALKASDDSYSQKDRDILAGEANQLFDQLEMTAQGTTYNGMTLLNHTTQGIGTIATTASSTTYVKEFLDFDPKNVLATPNTTIGNVFPSSPTRMAGSWWRFYNETITGYSPSSSGGAPPTHTLDFSNALAGHTIDDFDVQGFSVLCTGCLQFVSVVFSMDRDVGTGERQDPVETDSGSLANCRQYIIGINGAETAEDLANAVYDGMIAANRAHGDTGSAVNIIGEHDLTISRSGNSVSISQMSLYESGLQPIFYEGTKGVSVQDTDTIRTTTTQTIAEGLYPWEDRYIQSDPKGSQKTAIRLWNTTLDALFPAKDSNFLLDPESYPTEFNAADYPDPDEYPERYEGYTGTALQKKQQLWRDTIYEMTKKGAQRDGTCLRTREGAEDFLADLDQALKYCLHVATDFGAQMQRMEISDANIIASQENTTASESTIRDADMAKEMTAYTKNNILLQATQSMLSQANQNSSNVLSLLQ